MEKNSMMQSGVVLLNKATGSSSNAVVNKIKYAIGAKKAGHLGTLDPLGAGLLPITINKATRLFGVLPDKTKTYRAVFKFGVGTDTLDSEGMIVEKNNKIIDIAQLENVVKKYIGQISQMPPQYSAKKINGQKAYDIARSGGVAKLKEKQITVFDIKVIKQLEFNTFLFEISCSEGTYIRSLCRDIASDLSTYGTMCAICRTKCSTMQLCDSYTIDEIADGNFKLLKIDCLLGDLLKINLDAKFYDDLICGRKIVCDKSLNADFLVYCKNEFFGIACNDGGFVRIKTNLRG